MTLISQLTAIEALHIEYKQINEYKTKLAAIVQADAGAGDARVLTVSFTGATPFTYRVTTDAAGTAINAAMAAIWDARLVEITTALGVYLKSVQ